MMSALGPGGAGRVVIVIAGADAADVMTAGLVVMAWLLVAKGQKVLCNHLC